MLQQKCQYMGCRFNKLASVVFYALHHAACCAGTTSGSAQGEVRLMVRMQITEQANAATASILAARKPAEERMSPGSTSKQVLLCHRLTTFYTLSRIQIVPASICLSKAVHEDCTALLTGSCAEYKTCWMAPSLGIVRVEHGVFLSRSAVAYIMKRATRSHVGFEQQSAALLGCESWKGLIYQT